MNRPMPSEMYSFTDREDYGYIQFFDPSGRFIGHAAQLFDDEETPGPFETYAPHPTLYDHATRTGSFIPLGHTPTLLDAFDLLVRWTTLHYIPPTGSR